MLNARRRRIATAAILLFLAAAVPASAAGIANVASAAAAVRKASSVPVLLPTTLPDSIVGGGGLRATVVSATEAAYDVALTAGASCRSQACRVGFMRGMRTPPGPLVGREVDIAGVGPAYYEAASCVGGCVPSTLAWDAGGYRYMLGLRGATLNALRFTAASVRRPGP